MDALSGMTSDLSPSPPFFRHHRHNDPINVRVKEIYDMVPLESGEEDITSDENAASDARNNGRVVNKGESRGGGGSSSRKGNEVDHDDDDGDDS